MFRLRKQCSRRRGKRYLPTAIEPAERTHITLTLPPTSHDEVVAAPVVCAMIGNDNKAVVMALGGGGDFNEHTGIALDDYDLAELLI